MQGERPRSLLMIQARTEAAARKAAASTSTEPTALYRRVRPKGDASGPAYLALVARGAPPAEAVRGAAPADTEALVLNGCPPPTRGPATFSTAKTGRTPVTGIVVVRSVFPEERWRYAFNRWYNKHIPYVFTKGVFHTAYRYLAAAPDAEGRLLHWAFYETDLDDFPHAIQAVVAAARQRERGRFPPYLDVLPSWAFERVTAAPAMKRTNGKPGWARPPAAATRP